MSESVNQSSTTQEPVGASSLPAQPVVSSQAKSDSAPGETTPGMISGVFVPPQPDPAEFLATSTATTVGDNHLSLMDKIWLKTNLTWGKIVATLLTMQSLYGLYNSINFIFFEYAEVEEQLRDHIISQDVVNSFASKSIITVIGTTLSIVFAIRIALKHGQEEDNKVETIIGGTLAVANLFLIKYLNQIGSAAIVQKVMNWIFALGKGL
ncbi:MAG: hypothetical protein ACOZAN_01335 [Patescibacteria group bacterium]